MRPLRLPPLILSGLLQCLPLARVVTTEAMVAPAPLMALLRFFAAATAVAGSFHAVSGASIALTNPAGGKVRATNGIPSPFRISLTYTEGHTVLSPSVYDAVNLPPGFNQPTKSGSIWRITGTPTKSGVFSNVRVTGYENANKSGDHKATVAITITVVDAAPAISEQPKSLAVAAGSPAAFTVVASGGSLTYRWLKDDLEIPNGTGPTLALESVSTADAGTYRVWVQNSGGIVLSDPAVLTVSTPLVPPHFTRVPQEATLHLGEPLTLTAEATGSGTLAYAWFKDGQPVANANSSSLVMDAVTADDAGAYLVRVTGAGGAASSQPATVTVAPPLALDVPTLGSSGLRLPFNGIVGRTYVLESANTLATGSWELLDEVVAGEASAFSVTQLDRSLRLVRVRTK